MAPKKAAAPKRKDPPADGGASSTASKPDATAVTDRASIVEARKTRSAATAPPPGEFRDPDKEKFSYEDIVSGDIDGLDEDRKEQYLDDNEFRSILGMSKKMFDNSPKFKQTQLKKQFNLM